MGGLLKCEQSILLICLHRMEERWKGEKQTGKKSKENGDNGKRSLAEALGSFIFSALERKL